MPFANYSGRSEAPTALKPYILEQIARYGHSYLTETQLRPLLRRHRIRSIGMIDGKGARTIANETGVAYILLGSYDIYRTEENPEIALSMRVLETKSMSLISSASAAASGKDYAGLFDIGRVDDAKELAARVVADLFAQIEAGLERFYAKQSTASPRVKIALVPMDDLTDRGQSSGIVDNLILTGLIQRDIEVIEPGFVHEAFLQMRVMPSGQIDLQSLATLNKRYGIRFLLTGAVSRFKPARGAVEANVPELSIGIRLLDAWHGQILFSDEITARGDDSELLFRAGREYSLGKLAMSSIHDLTTQISKAMELEIAAPN